LESSKSFHPPKKFGANSAPELNLGPRSTLRKGGRSSVEHLRAKPASRYFSPGQNDFSLGQCPAGADGRLGSQSKAAWKEYSDITYRLLDVRLSSGTARATWVKKYSRLF